jgi:hypothetical protein
VLFAIVKKELQVDASLYTCLQILPASAFQKTELLARLAAGSFAATTVSSDNQLILFDI